jgi:hypothetical protein
MNFKKARDEKIFAHQISKDKMDKLFDQGDNFYLLFRLVKRCNLKCKHRRGIERGTNEVN